LGLPPIQPYLHTTIKEPKHENLEIHYKSKVKFGEFLPGKFARGLVILLKRYSTRMTQCPCVKPVPFFTSNPTPIPPIFSISYSESHSDFLTLL